MLEGVACLEGLDSLLLLLLADLGDARQVAAFAAVPNRVRLEAVRQRLQVCTGLCVCVSGVRGGGGGSGGKGNGLRVVFGMAAAAAACVWSEGLKSVGQALRPLAAHRTPQAEGWHHALATLHAARGDADVALATWRRVAEGQLAAGAPPGVAAAERREALQAAAALLRDPRACPEAALLAHIPWLLAAGQAEALGVLTARSLEPAAVLPLLPPNSDARWRYLAHLVAAEGAGQECDQALHTELATQLAAAILRADPSLRLAAAPGASPRRRVSGTGDGGKAGRPPSRTASSAAALPAGLFLPGTPGGGGRRASRSTAALVSGGGLEPAAGAPPVDAMRLRLRAHLEQSGRYDAEAVLAVLQGTGLHEELVVLHAKASPLRSGAGGGWWRHACVLPNPFSFRNASCWQLELA
jgi:hypothetical protein